MALLRRCCWSGRRRPATASFARWYAKSLIFMQLSKFSPPSRASRIAALKAMSYRHVLTDRDFFNLAEVTCYFFPHSSACLRLCLRMFDAVRGVSSIDQDS